MVLPQMEQNQLYTQIFTIPFRHPTNGTVINAWLWPWDMGPGGNYTPWRTQVANLRCPSDPGKMNPDANWFDDGSARTNYVMCYGDTTQETARLGTQRLTAGCSKVVISAALQMRPTVWLTPRCSAKPVQLLAKTLAGVLVSSAYKVVWLSALAA